MLLENTLLVLFVVIFGSAVWYCEADFRSESPASDEESGESPQVATSRRPMKSLERK